MTSTTLGQIIDAFGSGFIQPLNLEHTQAHFEFVHAACFQAVSDGMGYCAETEESFPYCQTIAELEEEGLMLWSDAFWSWYRAINIYDRFNLRSEIVVTPEAVLTF